MFPGVDGFVWSVGHVVFLGIFFAVLALIVTTMVISLSRSAKDIKHRRHDAIRWHADFEELSPEARKCRHEITGEFKSRTCENEFECRKCAPHAKLVAAKALNAIPHSESALEDSQVYGFDMPAGRFYHRGHAWVHLEPDGTATVGLDDLGAHLIGKADRVEYPNPGEQVRANGLAWRIRKGKQTIRILSPIDGDILATGGSETGWHLKIKPSGSNFDLRHLLQGEEVRPWMLREMERLQQALATTAVGFSLADGGEPVHDFTQAYPKANWDHVWGEMFLEP